MEEVNDWKHRDENFRIHTRTVFKAHMPGDCKTCVPKTKDNIQRVVKSDPLGGYLVFRTLVQAWSRSRRIN